MGKHERKRFFAARYPLSARLVIVAAVALIAATVGGMADQAQATPVAVAVSATTNLVDGQTVDVSLTGIPNGSTYVVVQCGPPAIQIVLKQEKSGDTNPEDGCEPQQNTLLFSQNSTSIQGQLQLRAKINAAVGTIDCTKVQCFIAFFPAAGGSGLQLVNISFASDACAAPGSCALGDAPGVAGRATPALPDPNGAPATIATASAGSPVSLTRTAGVAGDLSPAGSESGPAIGPLEQLAAPSTAVTGEGMVRLTLAAPGTDWGTNVPTSVVVDVSIDGGTTQQMVLFRGATPFVYAGFTGPLTTGDHSVTVAVDTALSQTGSQSPTVDVHDVQLQVVAPDNPLYRAFAYAPVMYGRSTSAIHDTPLLQYARSSPLGAGVTSLDYTEVFTHEDTGTAFVPMFESGAWGRMSDIESYFSLSVQADGTPSGPTFFSGNVPDDYPDTQNAIAETDVAFTGNWDGNHPIVRDATGNNDFSQVGTTPFRFQQAPVAPPASGRPREAVMDTNPWTYHVMGDEIARWYTNFTTNAAVPEQGDARQYAYIELHASGSGVTALGVDVQLDGDPTWYGNDFGSGYSLAGTGTSRTVVKLPLDWEAHTVTGVRIRVFPTSATSSVQVSSITIGELDQNWNFNQVVLPVPTIVDGFMFQATAPTTTTTTSTTTTSTTSTSTTIPREPSTSVAPTAPPGSTSTTMPSTPTTAGSRSADNLAQPATAVTAAPTFTG